MVEIGYVRVSTDEQNPDSQIKLILEKNIPMDLIFIDHGVSGMKAPEERPAYKKLLEFLKGGTVTALYVSEYSRLGRDTKSTLLQLINIEKMGIRVIALSPTDATVMSVPPELQPLLLSAYQLANDLEKKHNRERTKWGIENARASGKKIGRPTVEIDWNKIKEMQEKYQCSENMARKLCGYKASTFYKARKDKGGI